jgi:hypothetical protein
MSKRWGTGNDLKTSNSRFFSCAKYGPIVGKYFLERKQSLSFKWIAGSLSC